MNSSTILALRRRRLVLILIPLLAGFLVYLTTPTQTTGSRYTASETVTLDPAKKTSPATLGQAALLVKQPVISGQAAQIYGAKAESSFPGRISVEVNDKLYAITFSASGSDKGETERYVQAFADAFVKVMNAETTDTYSTQVVAATKVRETALKQLNDFLTTNAIVFAQPNPPPALLQQRQQFTDALGRAEQDLAQVKQRAQDLSGGYSAVGIVPASSSAIATLSLVNVPIVRAALAALLALLGMVAVVAIVERIAPRVSSREQVEEIVGAPVMAMVPLLRRREADLERISPDSFDGALAEAYRTLRVHLQFLTSRGGDGVANETSTVAIVSATPDDGKSTSAGFLAMSYVEGQMEALVLGCDFRRPSIHARFELPISPGFTDRAASGLGLAEVIRRDPSSGVRLLSSGMPTTRTTDVLPDIRAVIAAARTGRHQVIIDTAPVLVASETAQIAAMSDQVVFVVRAGQTSVRALNEAVTTLRLNNTNITGVVMIGSLESTDYYAYYDAYNPNARRSSEPATAEPVAGS